VFSYDALDRVRGRPSKVRGGQTLGLAVGRERTAVQVSVVVPTFNEEGNVAELVARLRESLSGRAAELVFVDDSSDRTPEILRALAADSRIPVRVIHRDEPEGGLSGAVVAGISASRGDWVVVMDGDLQHPPELIPALIDAGTARDAQLVDASRYLGGGSAEGLDGQVRNLVSEAATMLTRALFPIRLRDCTDPMTGFFAFRRSAVDVSVLHPHGFKILLEILSRQALRVTEVPFVFGARTAGVSKATFGQGLQFVRQVAVLKVAAASGAVRGRRARGDLRTNPVELRAHH
jgi:dolichol-phosphate mannosyltransferase